MSRFELQTLLGVSLCLFGRARLDLEQKYNASSFKFRTLDLVYVLFEEVLLMCEKKRKLPLMLMLHYVLDLEL